MSVESHPGDASFHAPPPSALVSDPRILLAVAGAEDAVAATLWTSALAQAAAARVDVLTVVEPATIRPPAHRLGWWERLDLERRLADSAARKPVEDAVRDLRGAGIDAWGDLCVGHPVAEIARAARGFEAGLVVLGSREHGTLGQLGLGSVGEAVRDRLEADVLLARTATPPVDVLIAVDDTEASHAATRIGLALAAAWGAGATILNVQESALRWGAPPVAFLPPRSDDARPPVTFLRRRGEPARIIVETAAQRRCGLVVMGSRAVGRAQGVLLGSTTRSVARKTGSSVLVVKGNRAWLPEAAPGGGLAQR